MPVTREITISYGGFSVGGSTARQITDYMPVERSYETGIFEFSFITSATTASAFQTEVLAVEEAFRKPRQDLTVSYGSGNTIAWKQSDNTGLDANPVITKRGDIGDTGRSRRYWVRIEFGLPADNVSTNFRRYSNVNIDYSPSRVRTVTINGVYTANSSNGTTGSTAQYLAQIATYSTTVLSGIDSAADWEKIGEPQVQRNETDKVTTFTVVFREIILDQSLSATDDTAIVNPVLIITREREAPGDSIDSPITFSGGGTTTSPGVNSGSNGTVVVIPGGTGSTATTSNIGRPIVLNLTYSCSLDYTITTDQVGKWTSTIRPFLLDQAKTIAGTAVTLFHEKPSFGDLYDNRFSVTMQFMTYPSGILSQKITVKETMTMGRVLHGVWDADPFSYYKFQANAVRTKTVTEEREQLDSRSSANAIAESLVIGVKATVQGIAEADKWTVVSRDVEAFSLRKGIVGNNPAQIATIKVVTVIQYGKFKKPSIANAGGVTGSTVTLA